MNFDCILRRAAKEIKAGDVVNFGIGLPTGVVYYLPADAGVLVHSENGLLGVGPRAEPGYEDPFLIDAGGSYITMVPGGAFMDSSVSFALIRRGKLDASVLGAFEVDQEGNLANWKIPGRFSPGIGGAMELAQRTKKVIVICSHTDKNGRPKVRRRCTLPLTAARCVSRIITDKAVFDVGGDHLVLREVAEDSSVEEVLELTEAEVRIPSEVGRF